MLERVVAVVIFGVGAAIGVEAVKAARGGLRPVAREAMRAGIAATETVRSATSMAGRAMAEVAEEARREYEQEKKLEASSSEKPSRRRAAPHKIEVVKE